MLTDLAAAARKSGLKVIELDGWKTNRSGGGEAYIGVGIHHTGGYDDVGDTSSDLAYARWMAFEGRPDLDPPLMNLGLSAESVVYVGAAGNANGMGEVRASGPMPAARDGNALYVVIEAYNSGTQGWNTKGRDAAGNPVTQYEGYVRLCAALCRHYGWSAEAVRAHWETSVTGKWDPGDPGSGAGPGGNSMDMRKFRAAVAWAMSEEDDDMPNYRDWSEEDRNALAEDVADAVLRRKVAVPDGGGKQKEITVKQAIARTARSMIASRGDVKHLAAEMERVLTKIDELNA